MSIKNLDFSDGKELNLRDSKKITTSNHSKAPQTLIHGEAEIYDQFGNLLQKKSNIILLGGRRFILEKLFNIELPADRKVTLNQLYNTNTTESTDTTPGPLKKKEVCLWGVGRGGSGLTFGDVNIPAEKEFNLYDQIPMRYVSVENDLPDDVKKNYYLRVLYGNDGSIVQDEEDAKYIAYYLKKFEADPELVINIGDNTYYPNITEDNLPTDWDALIERKDVEMYIQLRLKLSVNDVREFYIETESIDNARINELGIYFGYQPESATYSDYNSIEDFSKLTFNNERGSLKNFNNCRISSAA